MGDEVAQREQNAVPQDVLEIEGVRPLDRDAQYLLFESLQGALDVKQNPDIEGFAGMSASGAWVRVPPPATASTSPTRCWKAPTGTGTR